MAVLLMLALCASRIITLLTLDKAYSLLELNVFYSFWVGIKDFVQLTFFVIMMINIRTVLNNSFRE